MNLLGNALKATPEGGRVLIKAEQKGAGLAIEVLDSGCGIEPKDLPFIFERFYKGKDGASASASPLCGSSLKRTAAA